MMQRGREVSRRNLLFPTTIFFSFLFLLIACGEQTSTWHGTIEEVDGVTVINNPNDPVFSEPIFKFEEDLIIGESTRNENYWFAQIMSIGVDNYENIYVLDSKECEIKKYDLNGKYIGTIGRKGEGPGEFAYPIGMTIIEDEIVVEDAIRRLSFFSIDGNFKHMISTSKYLFIGTKMNLNGNFIARNNIRETNYYKFEIKLFDKSLDFKKNLFEASRKRKPGILLFPPSLIWTVSMDMIVIGYSDKYEFRIFDSKGELKKIVKKEYFPVKASDKDIEISRGDIPADREFNIPKYLPPFNLFSIDDLGNIFVQTNKNHLDSKKQNYDIYSPTGKYISEIDLSMTPRIWRAGKMYTIEKNKDGFPLVKRYKVTRHKIISNLLH